MKDRSRTKSRRNRGIWGPLLACLFTFVLGLFAVPVQQWILQWISSPDMHIQFEMEKPYAIKTLTSGRSGDKLYDVYPFRFIVENDDEYASARHCIVMITRYWHVDSSGEEHEEPNFEPLRIGWSHNARVDIGPGMEQLVPFLRIAEAEYQLENERDLSGDPNVPQLRFFVPIWPRWVSSHIPSGRHRILTTVFFDNRSPLEQKFEIEWSGKWSGSYEAMLKEIVIKKIEM